MKKALGWYFTTNKNLIWTYLVKITCCLIISAVNREKRSEAPRLFFFSFVVVVVDEDAGSSTEGFSGKGKIVSSFTNLISVVTFTAC